MATCRICHFRVEQDDIVLQHASGACVCLRCYLRETGQAQRMTKSLRRALITLLTAAEAEPA